MKRSSDRILTTHVGSLPRPQPLIDLLYARDAGEPVDEGQFDELVRRAVLDVVQRQARLGIDIVNDGESSKVTYVSYVTRRLDGFGGEASPPQVGADVTDFPEFARRRAAAAPARRARRPACDRPVVWKDGSDLERDLANLKAAFRRARAEQYARALERPESCRPGPEEAFMTAASPGVIASFMENRYYRSHEEYVFAIAEAMKHEYDAIHQAGFLLQVDCPDLALHDHPELNVAALHHALRDVPADGVRMHLCWGNYEGPHHRDRPLAEVVRPVLDAKPGAISFEGANPRHAHEWTVWQELRLPDDKIIIPGVIDTTTNFIEHPELVAQRIRRYAAVVGPERVIAGTDCGLSTGAGIMNVDPEIAWVKLESLVQGAELASKEG